MTDLEEVPDVLGVPDSTTVAKNDGDLARCARLVAALQDEAACVEAMARGQYESDTGCNWHSTELSSAYRSPYYTGATDAYRALLAHLTRDTTIQAVIP